MSDPFFRKARPFTKRKREEKTGRQGDGRKRGGSSKRGGSTKGKGKRSAERATNEAEEEEDEDLRAIEAQESDEDDDVDAVADLDDDEDERETPAQKRLRLSQMYLDSLKGEQEDEFGFDAAELDRDLIADRLQRDVLEHDGRLHRQIARLLPAQIGTVFRTARKGHRGALTCAVASHDGQWLYTASKDGSIIKWRLSRILDAGPSASTSSSSSPISVDVIPQAAYFRKSVSQVAQRKGAKTSDKGKEPAPQQQGHTDEVLSLAISHDGKVLASAGKDKVVGAWNVEGDEGRWLRALPGHRDAVSSVAFRLGTTELFTASYDRTVKLFDLSTLAYVETFFGHQDCLQDIDALRGELTVTAGGRDKTVRYWKVTEESQLVFRGGGTSKVRKVLENAMDEDVTASVDDDDLEARRRKRTKQALRPTSFVEGSIDCVAMVDDTTFLSGGDSGSICLWTTTKKKPIFSLPTAHGVNEYESETEGKIGTARWITALACLPYGDVFASGSWDGVIRLWKIDERARSFSPVATIEAHGVVNSLQLIHIAPPASDRKLKEDDAEGGKLLVVAGIGRELRLGRWLKLDKVREGALVAVVPLS